MYHDTPPAFKLPSWDLLRIFPIATPCDENLFFVLWNVVEELPSITVFPEISDARRTINGFKIRCIEVAETIKRVSVNFGQIV